MQSRLILYMNAFLCFPEPSDDSEGDAPRTCCAPQSSVGPASSLYLEATTTDHTALANTEPLTSTSPHFTSLHLKNFK